MKKKAKDPNYKPDTFGGSADVDNSFSTKATSNITSEVIVNSEKPSYEKEAPKGPVNHAPKKGL